MPKLAVKSVPLILLLFVGVTNEDTNDSPIEETVLEMF